MAAAVDITVVIPTRDRRARLERTLAELERQELEDATWQVVVVDNGSSDGTGELLRAMAERELPFEFSAVHEPAPGRAPARNAALRAARGHVLLFLGDDTRPAFAGFVAGHLEEHRRDPSVHLAVAGYIGWDPEAELTPVMDWLARSGKVFDFPRAQHEAPGPYLFYTSNLSLKREALERVGGFDERFALYGWEDKELALRLFDDGLRLVYRPGLRVHHRHHYDLRASLARMQAVGSSGRLLNELHPQRRPPPAPVPAGAKARVALVAAPLLLRLPPPPRLRGRARDRWFQVAHFAALAHGYRHSESALRSVDGDGAATPDRPAVSVIVPFLGSTEHAAALVERLLALHTREGDELIVADNSASNGAAPAARGGVRVLPAGGERSSYHARNVGAGAARNDWLLFLDTDCVPPPDLLERYFHVPVPSRVGAVAGEVVEAEADSLVARYAASRRHISQAASLRHPYKPFGVTANLLVRREAWEGVGGFAEGVRSGGDSDFCWRIQDAGWLLGYGKDAAVGHHHRASVRALARQYLRYGAGHAWRERRHPGSSPRPRVAAKLARSLAGIAVWTVAGQRERAKFKALDALVVTCEALGYTLGNTPPGARKPPPALPGALRVAVLTDLFPELSETFITNEVRALQRAGHRVRVESGSRARQPQPRGGQGISAAYAEDDGRALKLGALTWLVLRHPLAAARDRLDRRAWAREEAIRSLASLAPVALRLARARDRHLHAHFAGAAALDAFRLGRLLGLPYSVTAHAYDIYKQPRNLALKLRESAFATSGCEYTVRDLREIAGPEHAERVHEIVMGVDGRRFRRRTPYPDGSIVAAVGRLVEKKGFAHLIDALALQPAAERPERLLIAGDGPLRRDLEAQIRRLGLEDTVQLLGPQSPDAIRDLLERAALLAMPCVVAGDGDRDSMPVVVKEALAMEIPVVASDEVGLPELVRPEWGRLVPPHDPAALAAALGELLALPPERRHAMGRAGRAFVLEHCDVDRETAKLAGLIARAAG